MAGINTARWLAGGVVAGVIMWLIEGGASLFYGEDMEAVLAAHNLAITMSTQVMVMTILVCLIAGLTLVFLYAAMRPRFGPGPRTAVIAAVVLWFGGTLLSLIGYGMIHLYPHSMLLAWGVVGLVEMILAALAGAWVYRERE